MIKLRHMGLIACGLIALLLSACEGAAGQPGQPGPQGTEGPAGPPGPAGTAGQGDLEVTVVDGALKTPLAGASVITDPATVTSVTDAAGKAFFKQIPAGSYKVVATAKDFETTTSPVVGIANGLTTKLTVPMLRAGGTATGPTVTVTAPQLQAGYGKTFTVTATAADPDDDPGKLTFKWTQSGGPKVTLAGDTTSSVSFTAKGLAETYGPLPARLGVLGINPDQSGTYTFKVTVTDPAGNKAEATATVACASPTTGLANAPIGVRVFLNGAAGAASYAWTLTEKPSGSAATLADDKSRNPSFLPDKEGKYLVSETASGKTLEIHAGTWVGVEGKESACTGCHNGSLAPDQFTPVKKTGHAQMLAWQLDGGDDPANSHYSEACLSCHTVGFDRSVVNGGFDDLAKSKGWTFPAKLQPGNWDELKTKFPEVAQLGNIQCENCHGPQGSGGHTKGAPRISFASEVCASCHQSGSHHYKPGLLAKSKHSNLETAQVEATFEKRGTSAAHCGRCHAAQGFKLYAAQLAKGTDPSKYLLKPDGSAADEAFLRGLGLQMDTVEPITCAACHDPHSDANPAQLRVFGSQKLAAGFAVSGAGGGALCMTCHNTRNGARGDAVGEPTNYGAPHVASQSDVLYGKNFYYLSGINVGKHTAVAETCVGCHVKASASFLTATQTSNHSFKADRGSCKTCHGTAVDGEALAAVVEAELHGLADKLGAALVAKIDAQLTAGGSFAVRAWDPDSDWYSSTAPSGQTPASNVVITTKPTKAEPTEIHGQQGFTLTLPAPISFTVQDGKGGQKNITTDKVSFQLGSLMSSGTTALLAKSDPIVKAGWNYYMLHGDGSKGVHNPSLYIKVIDASRAALP